MRVRATRTVEYEILVYAQLAYDPEDGTGAGWYAWVGPPGAESVLVVGPCPSRMAARTSAVKRLERMGYAVERADA